MLFCRNINNFGFSKQTTCCVLRHLLVKAKAKAKVMMRGKCVRAFDPIGVPYWVGAVPSRPFAAWGKWGGKCPLRFRGGASEVSHCTSLPVPPPAPVLLWLAGRPRRAGVSSKRSSERTRRTRLTGRQVRWWKSGYLVVCAGGESCVLRRGKALC